MLSLRSLAFILCSAIRRARALSSIALHCFPDRINGRKMATNTATNKATIFSASMCSLLRRVYTSPRRSRLGAQRTRLGTRATSPDSCNELSVEVRPRSRGVLPTNPPLFSGIFQLPPVPGHHGPDGRRTGGVRRRQNPVSRFLNTRGRARLIGRVINVPGDHDVEARSAWKPAPGVLGRTPARCGVQGRPRGVGASTFPKNVRTAEVQDAA
jgi:hypothetical protein